MTDLILLIPSSLFIMLIILLNLRFNAKEGMFILSTVLAFFVLITQFVLINVISIPVLKSLTHLIVFIIYFVIVIFQIYKHFSFGKPKRKNQKKFIKERK